MPRFRVSVIGPGGKTREARILDASSPEAAIAEWALGSSIGQRGGRLREYEQDTDAGTQVIAFPVDD